MRIFTEAFIKGSMDGLNMEIDNHVFERMSIRLDENEKQRVIDAIEAKWGRLQNNQLGTLVSWR